MPAKRRRRGTAKSPPLIYLRIRTERLLPTHRRPTHAGEMLLEEWLKPLGMSQAEFARRSGIPYLRLNALIRKRRGITVDIALRLAQVLGTTPEIWLNLQQAWDLWHALQSPTVKQIAKLRPLQTRRRSSP